MNITKTLLTIAVCLLLAAGCSGGGSDGDTTTNTDDTTNTDGGGNSGGDSGGGTGDGGDNSGGDNGGGDDPISTGNITDGIWIGTYTDNGTSTDFDVVIYDNHFYGFTQAQGYEGVLTLDNDSISGTLNAYENTGNIKTEAVSIDGTVVENISITGSLGAGGATFDLALDALYNRTASLTKTTGNWAITVGTYVLTFSIMENGMFDGSDTTGCVFNGDLSVPDPDHNIYLISYTVSDVSSCALVTGDFSGLALLDDVNSGTDNALVISSVTTDFLNIGYLIRQ